MWMEVVVAKLRYEVSRHLPGEIKLQRLRQLAWSMNTDILLCPEISLAVFWVLEEK
jgi:hypothetical protein